MGPRAESTPGLSADDSAAYVAYQQFVYKVDGKSGSELWRYPETGTVQVVLYASPLVAGEYFYVGDLANKFHQLDLSDGSENWTFADAKGWYQAKAASDGSQIIVPNSDRNVYSLDLDGTLNWTYSSEYGYLAEPVILDDSVIISSLDHNVVSLDKGTGEVNWKAELKGSVVSAPLFDAENNRLYIGSLGKEFVSMDSQTGEINWTFTADGKLSSVWSTPILIENNLIVADEEGKIFSLDPETGTVLWTLNSGSEIMAGLLAIDGGFVVALENGDVRAYDLEQNPLWTRTIEGEIYTTPVLLGDTIIVAVTKGEALLYSYDLIGNPGWSFTPAK